MREVSWSNLSESRWLDAEWPTDVLSLDVNLHDHGKFKASRRVFQSSV